MATRDAECRTARVTSKRQPQIVPLTAHAKTSAVPRLGRRAAPLPKKQPLNVSAVVRRAQPLLSREHPEVNPPAEMRAETTRVRTARTGAQEAIDLRTRSRSPITKGKTKTPSKERPTATQNAAQKAEVSIQGGQDGQSTQKTPRRPQTVSKKYKTIQTELQGIGLD